MTSNYCKCGKEIPSNEKKCEHCKKKQKHLRNNIVKGLIASSSAVLLKTAIKAINEKS